MSALGRVSRLVVALAFLLAAQLVASPASDFAARLGQTVWSLQQVEALVRAQPQSSAPAAAPEALSSFLGLATENVNALTAIAEERVTDEQHRVMAAGLKAVRSLLHDDFALAGNRGLASVVSALSSLEGTCDAAVSTR